jgi:hypothetical protein
MIDLASGKCPKMGNLDVIDALNFTVIKSIKTIRAGISIRFANGLTLSIFDLRPLGTGPDRDHAIKMVYEPTWLGLERAPGASIASIRFGNIVNFGDLDYKGNAAESKSCYINVNVIRPVPDHFSFEFTISKPYDFNFMYELSGSSAEWEVKPKIASNDLVQRFEEV